MSLNGYGIFSYVLSPESFRGGEAQEHLIRLLFAAYYHNINLE